MHTIEFQVFITTRTLLNFDYQLFKHVPSTLVMIEYLVLPVPLSSLGVRHFKSKCNNYLIPNAKNSVGHDTLCN